MQLKETAAEKWRKKNREKLKVWHKNYNASPERKAYMKKWRAEHKTTLKAANQDRHNWNQKIRMLTAVANGKEIKCVKCGNRDRRVLQVHHINGDGLRDCHLYDKTIKTLKLHGKVHDLDTLEIRCANCNIIAEYEELKRRYKNLVGFDENHNPIWKELPKARYLIKPVPCTYCGAMHKPRSRGKTIYKLRFCSRECYDNYRKGGRVSASEAIQKEVA